MTQKIITITVGAGQARPRRRSKKHTRRRVRVNLWTVAKYATLTVAGILLFRAGTAYAFRCRGYAAVGGETPVCECMSRKRYDYLKGEW